MVRSILERWGVRARVLCLGALLIGLTAVTSLVGLRGAATVSAEAEASFQHSVPAINLLLNIDRDGYQSNAAAVAIAHAAPGSDVETSRADFAENSEQMLSRFDEYRALALGVPGEDVRQQEFLDTYAAWLAAVTPIVEGTSADPVADLAAVDATFQAWRDTIDLLQAEFYEPAVAVSQEEIADSTSAMRTQIFGALGLALLLGGAAAWFLARNVGRRVTASAKVVGDASGRLDVVSVELESSATRTAGEAQVVAESSRQVDASMQTVAAAVEELTASVNEIASSAAQASSVADRALSATRSAASTANDLGGASSEVGQVVALITSIAEQTNLLALNATIEAARAGAAGSGFAIVANEVKELARQTGDATDVIRTRVEGIQASSNQIVGAIADISGVIDEVHGYTATIASAVEEQSITASEIGRSMAEAAHASSAITSGIQAVAGTAAGTLATAHATREAAEELDGASSDLWQLVKGNGGSASAPQPPANGTTSPPSSGTPLRAPAQRASAHVAGSVHSDDLQPV
jgi:methyl-accepting chemotaxis protein